MPRFELHPQDIAFSFLALLFEAIPFLLFGSLISGLIERLPPATGVHVVAWCIPFVER